LDLYNVLGVPKNASTDDVKKAYRKLALETHPDRNPGDKGAEERFRNVTEAYETLSDPQRRAEYDNPNPFKGFNPFSGTGFENIFRSAGSNFGFSFDFGGGGRREAPRHGSQEGEKITHSINISPFEILLSANAQLKYNKLVHCRVCDGHGADLVMCSECKGSGFISQVIDAGHQRVRRDSPCGKCMGRGFVKSNACNACGGNGLVTEEVVEMVPLSSVDNRGVIFIPGKGHCGPFKGPAGPLIIEVNVIYPPQDRIDDESRQLLRAAADKIYKRD